MHGRVAKRCKRALASGLMFFIFIARDVFAADPTFDPLDEAQTLPSATKSGADLSLGLLANTGNTRSSTLTARGALDQHTAQYDNRADLLYVDSHAQGELADRKFSIADKLKYELGKHHYAFGLAHYDHDQVAAIRKRYSIAAGAGRHLLHDARDQFDLDLGLGWSSGQAQDEDDFDGRMIGVIGAVYAHPFNAQSQFRQTVQTEFSSHDLYLASVSTLRLKVSKRWFVSLDYELRHNRKAAAGLEHTDEIRSANIGFDFGKPPKQLSPSPEMEELSGDSAVGGRK